LQRLVPCSSVAVAPLRFRWNHLVWRLPASLGGTGRLTCDRVCQPMGEKLYHVLEIMDRAVLASRTVLPSGSGQVGSTGYVIRPLADHPKTISQATNVLPATRAPWSLVVRSSERWVSAKTDPRPILCCGCEEGVCGRGIRPLIGFRPLAGTSHGGCEFQYFMIRWNARYSLVPLSNEAGVLNVDRLVDRGRPSLFAFVRGHRRNCAIQAVFGGGLYAGHLGVHAFSSQH
jgi:hypothetical protein